MKLWLIAIWKTIPSGWLVISAPFVLPLLALAIWFAMAGLFADPINLDNVAYAEEVERLRPLAANGDIPALLRIGAIQRDGLTGNVDGVSAFRLFEKAARKGSVPGQFALGDLYTRGLGVRRDYVRAAEWFRLAGGLGRHVEAQYALGDLYFFGRGVAHDYGNARQWYERAARQGHPAAQLVLGAMYERGWGVNKDLVEAFVRYKLAARNIPRLKKHREAGDPLSDLVRVEAKLNRHDLRVATRRLRSIDAKARP